MGGPLSRSKAETTESGEEPEGWVYEYRKSWEKWFIILGVYHGLVVK